MQDSFGESKYSGVRFLYPFSNKGIKGNLKWMYGSGDKRNIILTFILLVLFLVNILIREKIYEIFGKLSANPFYVLFFGLIFYTIIISLTYYIFYKECKCKFG